MRPTSGPTNQATWCLGWVGLMGFRVSRRGAGLVCGGWGPGEVGFLHDGGGCPVEEIVDDDDDARDPAGRTLNLEVQWFLCVQGVYNGLGLFRLFLQRTLRVRVASEKTSPELFFQSRKRQGFFYSYARRPDAIRYQCPSLGPSPSNPSKPTLLVQGPFPALEPSSGSTIGLGWFRIRSKP